MTGFATFDSADGRAPGRGESLADIIEWLFLVFEARLGLVTVLAVIHECCRELDIDSHSTLLGRLELLAHERLTALALAEGATATCPEPARLASRTGPRTTTFPPMNSSRSTA